MTQLNRRDFVAGLGIPFFGPRDKKVAQIKFKAHRHGKSNRRYFHVHGNETTARDVLLDLLKTSRGTAYLIENDVRNARLNAGNIDPNRMFSREGAERSLRRLNPGWPESTLYNALLALEKDRLKLVKALIPPDDGLLVAMHNNSAGYSIKDEIPISDRHALNDPQNPRDFLLATAEADYDRIAKSPFNVVLQRNPPPPDDGSLSRLCNKYGIRYVNIEAALGNFQKQKQMLQFLDTNLPA
jgi:hypothetical protein